MSDNSKSSNSEPDAREVAECTHWLHHRLCAKRLTGYHESTLLADEWMVYGGLPEEAQMAIERGDTDLLSWCPQLGERGRREAALR